MQQVALVMADGHLTSTSNPATQYALTLVRSKIHDLAGNKMAEFWESSFKDKQAMWGWETIPHKNFGK